MSFSRSLPDSLADTAPFLSQPDETEVVGERPTEPQDLDDAPPSGVSKQRAWLCVAVLCYVNLLNYMDRFTVAGVLPDIENFFNIGDSNSGLLQTVFICSYMVLAPVFGYLGDRYNRKYIMCAGILFWSAVTLGSSYIPKEHFWLLLLTRGLVGVGEASYSTIAPTIIADLYVADQRSRMLSIFYFAIPVGSGLGYIVGSSVLKQTNDWHWALRVTPALGLLAVVLLLLVLKEPKRGAVEERSERSVVHTSWMEDLRALSKNTSFILSSLGFTSVAFVTGSLALWAPAFLLRARVVLGNLKPCLTEPCISDDSLIFGVITCVTGILGVGLGVEVSRRLRVKNPRADPLVCATGMLMSSPFLFLAIICAESSTVATYVFIFLGETFLSLNWAIVADILLYVVVPTRRSTAEALQIIVSHLLGDAGSPYLIGTISDSIRSRSPDSFLWQFKSLQYSLLLCSFVAVIGGGFFLATALFVERDRTLAQNQMQMGDEPIVVPKRGRSKKVPVSSVLI
ncbi:protein spinster homolog 1 [Erpetoichthys calabaricus]|uniref:Protein spinster homolog 1 n=1 Tax=Erpetoichthys calabaricus TaxID=27687 RepID=A0A8C4SW42_ERPCA|nr:protein spinster homolog 1 [Erpetoichthys calabaricus]XP_051790712.1 protein spinster homolog 1 [Erpetoichthys calabaricus]